MFRLILSCLETCKEQEVLEIIVRKLTELVINEEVVVLNHLEDILSRVLNLTIFENSMVSNLNQIK